MRSSAAVAQTSLHSDFHVLDPEASTISEALFRKLDADDSGYLSKRELLHARTTMMMGNADVMLQTGMLSQTIDHLLHDIDADHDNRVTLDEWQDFARSLFEVMGKKKFIETVSYWTSTIHKRSSTHHGHRRGSHAHTSPAPGEHTRLRAEHAVKAHNHSPENSTAPHAKHYHGAHHLRPSSQLSHTVPVRPSSQQSHNSSDTIRHSDDRASSSMSRTAPTRHAHHRGSLKQPQPHAPGTPSSQCSGGLARKTTRSKSPAVHQSLEDQLEDALKTLPVTVEDVWEMMTYRSGQRSTRIDVDDILLMFEGCRRVGLDMTLQSIAPLDKYSEVTPEDLSCGEVAHLCVMLIENHLLTEEEAREKLDLVKEKCRSLNGMREVRSMVASEYGREDKFMSLHLFSRLLQFLSDMMQIEKITILTAIVWCELGWFELSETLANLLVEHCARKHHKHAHEDPDALWKSLNATLSGSNQVCVCGARFTKDSQVCRKCGLRRAAEADTGAKQQDSSGSLRFSLNDWARMVRNCGIKMQQEVITGIYAHAIHRVQTEPHMRPKHRVDAHSTGSEHVRVSRAEDLRPLQGYWELERLMEELWKHDTMHKTYISPLAMVTALIIKATNDPQLTSHHGD